jgi:uncharacterized protein
MISRLSCSLLLSAGIFLWTLPLGSTLQAESAKTRVLVLSGRNNHDWRSTTPQIVSALKESGGFDVDVEEDVAGLKPEKIEKYDVILSNFNTFPKLESVWGKETRDTVEAYLKKGHGLVIVHAGSAVFYDWPFFQKLSSATWGPHTHHAKIHQNEVSFTEVAHPITAGLKPFQTTDEFWENAMITDDHAICLATVTPSKSAGGSGNVEKIMFCNEVDGARGFTLLLGHNANGMSNPMWRTLLQRGTQWAATGKVSEDHHP